jgi:hypothetical protein
MKNRTGQAQIKKQNSGAARMAQSKREPRRLVRITVTPAQKQVTKRVAKKLNLTLSKFIEIAVREYTARDPKFRGFTREAVR